MKTAAAVHPRQIEEPEPGSPEERKRTALDLIVDLLSANLSQTAAQEWLAGSIAEILGAEVGALILLQADQGELVIKKSWENEAHWYYQLDLERDIGLVKKHLQEHSSLLMNRAAGDQELPFLRSVPDLLPESILCTPLVCGGQLLGGIAVMNHCEGTFSREDQEQIEKIAAAAAHQLYNNRLIQQLTVTNADLEASHWQLLRSRNTLRTLFDSIPASIYIIDRKYTLAAINMHRARRTNEPPNLLVGRLCYEALYQRDEVCPGCRVMETLFGGQSTSRTNRVWDLEDEAQEWEISTYPIYDDSNQVIQAILLEQDVTEKRRLEATLAQSEKLAAVGQLAAGLAHEINNPLTAIIANAQLLQREISPEDDKQELVDLIARAGARAAQVVRNLLDLARKEQYEFTPVDLNETLQKALKLLQHELMARSIEMVFEPAEELPLVKASQDHIQGVWINLLTNAIDSLENGNSSIRISTRQQGNEVRVVISDTGKGIPPQKLSRIFEPFYTTKAPGRGTGLGLSVCHRVIKQHGGRILVDSQLGVGTQFTVILPIAQEKAKPEEETGTG